jgi:hypothetical protein
MRKLLVILNALVRDAAAWQYAAKSFSERRLLNLSDRPEALETVWASKDDARQRRDKRTSPPYNSSLSRGLWTGEVTHKLTTHEKPSSA